MHVTPKAQTREFLSFSRTFKVTQMVFASCGELFGARASAKPARYPATRARSLESQDSQLCCTKTSCGAQLP
jgi:hypothetical protein